MEGENKKSETQKSVCCLVDLFLNQIHHGDAVISCGSSMVYFLFIKIPPHLFGQHLTRGIVSAIICGLYDCGQYTQAVHWKCRTALKCGTFCNTLRLILGLIFFNSPVCHCPLFPTRFLSFDSQTIFVLNHYAFDGSPFRLIPLVLHTDR